VWISRAPANPEFLNTILWGNEEVIPGTTEINCTAGGAVTLGYCDIEGGLAGIPAGTVTTNGPVYNMNPQFTPAIDDGPWTSVEPYNAATRQTTLTRIGADWTPGEFVGRFLNPNVAQRKQFIVYTNTSNSITVWGDATLVAAPGNSFRISEYKLSPVSPCADIGTTSNAPSYDVVGNTRPLGIDVDLRAYEIEPPPASLPGPMLMVK